jgi:hypothetical protein
MKSKAIHLRTIENPNTVDGLPRRYRVAKIVNSTDYAPGDIIDKQEVDELCALKEWNVVIVS